MRIRLASACLGSLIVLTASTADAARQQPENLRDLLVAGWNEVGQKIIKAAEEFPEGKYDFKATADVRTFGDQLRHVAFWNTYVAKSARGEKADGSLNELPRADYPTKAQVVAVLRRTIDEAAAELKKLPPSPPLKTTMMVMSFIEHTGEHYGQLVVYYRLNGLVPPASRGQ